MSKSLILHNSLASVWPPHASLGTFSAAWCSSRYVRTVARVRGQANLVDTPPVRQQTDWLRISGSCQQGGCFGLSQSIKMRTMLYVHFFCWWLRTRVVWQFGVVYTLLSIKESRFGFLTLPWHEVNLSVVDKRWLDCDHMLEFSCRLAPVCDGTCIPNLNLCQHTYVCNTEEHLHVYMTPQTPPYSHSVCSTPCHCLLSQTMAWEACFVSIVNDEPALGICINA